MLTYAQPNVRAKVASAAWPISDRCKFAVPMSRQRAFTNVSSALRSGVRTDEKEDPEFWNMTTNQIAVARMAVDWRTRWRPMEKDACEWPAAGFFFMAIEGRKGTLKT